MNELIEVMQDILSELREINTKLNNINGIYTLDDIHSKLDDIMGVGLYNSLSDICNKLDNVDNSISILD